MRPLVDDPRLGFRTGPQQPMHLPLGGATRLASTVAPDVPNVRSHRGWLILAILMVIGVAAGVVIAMQAP